MFVSLRILCCCCADVNHIMLDVSKYFNTHYLFILSLTLLAYKQQQ